MLCISNKNVYINLYIYIYLIWIFSRSFLSLNVFFNWKLKKCSENLQTILFVLQIINFLEKNPDHKKMTITNSIYEYFSIY